MMVAAVSETTTRNHVIRPPLMTSEKVDGDVITPKSSIKPKTRQVSSRYLSPSPSPSISSNSNSNSNCRRANSPLISRNSSTPVAKRAVSVDRRRPCKPNNAGSGGGGGVAGELSAASKLLVTSTRSLSVSFQGESFSLPISKTKVTPQSPNLFRKGTPERKRTPAGNHFENTKSADHHRWPGRIRQPNDTVLSKRLTFDCEVQRDFDCRRASFDGCKLNLTIDPSNGSTRSGKDSGSDTDMDSVSSGSCSGIQEYGSAPLRIGPSGIILSPKFWQETNSRMRRLQGSGSPLSTSPNSKPKPKVKPNMNMNTNANTAEKNFSSKRFSSDNYAVRASSPIKVMMRSSSPLSSSVLSFAVDVRRGKVGENRFLDAHVLRLLYNRQLQWRFVNARSEDVVLKQKHNVEENLWNAWITMSDMRDSVTKKRYRLQLLRQKLKLASILKAHMVFLDDWAYLDKEHSVSLVGAIKALKASTLRLPVGAGATADLQSVKDAISSALDVMKTMGTSMKSLGSQVEEVNLMVTEIAKVSAKERALLRICKDLLSIFSALKVKDCSLRTHMLQTCRSKRC